MLIEQWQSGFSLRNCHIFLEVYKTRLDGLYGLSHKVLYEIALLVTVGGNRSNCWFLYFLNRGINALTFVNTHKVVEQMAICKINYLLLVHLAHSVKLAHFLFPFFAVDKGINKVSSTCSVVV